MSLGIGTLLNNRYAIVRKLGKGCFGETFLAQDNYKQNESVVVKRLMIENLKDEYLIEAQQAFEREAETLHRLNRYSQIPHLKAHFAENNDFFLVMEYIAENNMSELELKEGNNLNENQVIDLLLNILEVVDILHKNMLIHRDIKPDNLIRRAEDGKIVLIDFGSVTEELNMRGFIRQGRAMAGSPIYAAPEQFRGESYFSSDLYAVGMIGIQALTGEIPSNLRTLDSQEKEWEHLVPDISERLKTIIRKMTCYIPSHRYQTVEEVLKGLQSIITPKPKEKVLKSQEQVNRKNKNLKILHLKQLLFGLLGILLIGTVVWMWLFRSC